MNRKNERKWFNAKISPRMEIIIVIFVIIVMGSLQAFLKAYGSYNDRVLYRERLHQMQQVTIELFESLEKMLQKQWSDVAISGNYLCDYHPDTIEEMQGLMAKQIHLNNLDQKEIDFIAVDSKGRYYSQNGIQGTLTEMSYILSMPERVSFVSSSMTTEETAMYFLKKLEQPLKVKNGQETIEIIYYGMQRDMNEFNPYFVCSAYEGNNSVYVLNENGEKLFSSSDLIQGYNIYSILGEMDYLHGSSLDEAKKELTQNGIAYSNAVLNGEEYYYALYQMNNADWTLLFLVPSDSVAMDTVSLIRNSVRFILVFIIIMVAISITAIVTVLRMKQMQDIDVERHNNEVLERVNTELKEAVAAAEEANRAKSDFLSNMSHDIRTPMNTIVGVTSLMEQENGLSEQQRLYIKKTKLAGNHLLGLINDILDMSKIEAGELILNEEPICLAQQIGQVETIIRAQSCEKNQRFDIVVNHITAENLIGDGLRLRQIFLNLLSNATKYTDAEGSFCLLVEEKEMNEEGFVCLHVAVSDTGCGMTKEFIEHIFEPFLRAENSVTNKVQGTGLGMAITKQIVDKMNGTIKIQSKEGVGSCFEIDLPMQIDTGFRYETTFKNILCLSKDEALIRNMQAAVSGTDIILLCGKDEKEGLEILKMASPDVILVDYSGKNEQKEMLYRLKEVSPCDIFVMGKENTLKHTITDFNIIDEQDVRPFFLSKFLKALKERRTVTSSKGAHGDSVLKGLHFLCAEDHSFNAEILKALLALRGADCTIYPNGAELVDAFEHAKPGEYDAILMDIQMPVMNGLDAARAVRHSINPLGKTIPIFAMTANAFLDDKKNSMEAGMNAHISKPIDISDLEQQVKKFVL